MFKSLPYQDENGTWIIELSEQPNELEKEFTDFFANYEIDDLIIEGNEKPKTIDKTLRICRFCGKSMPEVTFKKEAHTVSQLLGNKYLISDFECDTCNQFFSKYENEISAILGLSRTMSFLKGQNGIPKYKTPDKKLEVGHDKIKNKINIISEGLENDHWEINEENKTVVFHSVKHPYTPVKVYKALLKMGMCHMEEEDLSGFTSIINFLKSDDKDSNFENHPLFRLYIHLFPGPPIPNTLVFRMKRKENPDLIACPKFSFVIYTGNYIFQYFMPFYKPDHETFAKEKKVNLPICPPLLGKEWCLLHGIPKRGFYNLSKNERRINEPQVITMSYDSMKYHDLS